MLGLCWGPDQNDASSAPFREVAEVSNQSAGSKKTKCPNGPHGRKSSGVHLECSAKTKEGLKVVFDEAIIAALSTRGYEATSALDKTCFRCKRPSRRDCLCEVRKSITETVRMWCRILCAPERVLSRASGMPKVKMLLDFFVERPVGHHACIGA